MRKSLYILFSILLFSSSVYGQEEKVYSFHSEIDIEVSGDIQVREIIRVYAAGNVFKRGVTRALPLVRQDADGRRIKVSYKINKVLQDGKKADFFTEREGDDLVVYVGDKNKFLDPGFYNYEIFYTSPGQLGFFEDYDELYWNVNGLSDHVTDTVSCVVRMPGGAQIISHRCYTGVRGATEGDCRSAELDDGSFFSEATNLNPDEMLTIAVSFTPGVVQQKGTATYRPTHFDRYGLVYFTVIFLLFFSVYYSRTWRKYGIDPPKPVVIPQFSPPDGLSPASVGMLHKEVYVDELITSAIVSLAVKGFIRIKEEETKGIFGLKKEKHFTLIKLKDADGSLPDEESKVMSELFKINNETTITGKYDKDMENMMRSFRTSLKRQYSPVLNEGRNLKLHIIPWLLVPVYLFAVAYFSVFESQAVVKAYVQSLAIAFVPLIFVVFLITGIVKKLRRRFLSILIGLFALTGSVAAIAQIPLDGLSPNGISFLAGMPVLVIGYLVYSYLIVRPGERKLDYQAKIEGLKMYIDVAEEKQMQFFNPPDITPEIFEQLLPYAIALNMDKIWGEKFQDKFLSSLAQQTPYQPAWYAGTVMRPSVFGNSLRTSLYSNIRSSAAAPSSSGGGNWSSGSSGGGFSGGGGGGGRVGGW